MNLKEKRAIIRHLQETIAILKRDIQLNELFDARRNKEGALISQAIDLIRSAKALRQKAESKPRLTADILLSPETVDANRPSDNFFSPEERDYIYKAVELVFSATFIKHGVNSANIRKFLMKDRYDGLSKYRAISDEASERFNRLLGSEGYDGPCFSI